MPSILQPWVERLGLRHQGTLLASIRGCDTAPKNDPSKNLARCIRAEILIPFCGDAKKSASFIEEVEQCELIHRMLAFSKNHDHYPSHYVGHLVLTAEIIGYKKPSPIWLEFYRDMVRGMHLSVETEDQLDERLGMSEEEFGAHQNH